MRHFLDIEHLSSNTILKLLDRANYFKDGGMGQGFSQHTLAQLFYENSTRTRISFEMAAKNLGMRVVNVDLARSSEQKGESLNDTVLNLHAMGINHFVIRHSQDFLPQYLAERLNNTNIHLVSAGDGQHEHPSQAMLDLMTILSHKPSLDGLKIVLVGNIRHSRVANSLQWALSKLGSSEFVMVAPPVWQPVLPVFGRVSDDLDESLKNADVVIVLRVQRERLMSGEDMEFDDYRRDYAISAEKMKLAHRDAIVMHPGPVNRGFEIDSALVDAACSKILQQVQNGVFMRMAILEAMLV